MSDLDSHACDGDTVSIPSLRDQMIAAANELAIPVVDYTPSAPTIVLSFSLEKHMTAQYPDLCNANIVAAVTRAIVRLRPTAIHLENTWPIQDDGPTTATVITHAEVSLVGVLTVSIHKWIDDEEPHHLRRAYNRAIKKNKQKYYPRSSASVLYRDSILFIFFKTTNSALQEIYCSTVAADALSACILGSPMACQVVTRGTATAP